MRLAVVGSNGLTGFHVVRAALQQGLEVIPVARDERDQERVAPLFPSGQVRFADPTAPSALRAALDGATHLVCSLDPRGQGPGCPWYPFEAAPNVVEAAVAVGIEKMLMVSVVGAWRWAPTVLNRRAFQMDKRTRLVKGPWTLVRVSCYHDEVLEGHVRPPDGRRPHPVPSNGQYSPISRQDAGRCLLNLLLTQPSNRLYTMGGPRLYTSAELQAAIAPYIRAGQGGKTGFPCLPKGDLGVQPSSTWATCNLQPTETLEDYLTGRSRPPETGGGETHRPFDRAPAAAGTKGPLFPRQAPGPSPWDLGDPAPVLSLAGPDLRRVIHQDLGEALRARGLAFRGLDFGHATAGPRSFQAHGGTGTSMRGVRAVGLDGGVVWEGDVEFVRDEMAEVLYLFWGAQIPDRVWDALDLGVRRRLREDPHWASDPRVSA